MQRSNQLREEDLQAVSAKLWPGGSSPKETAEQSRRAKARIEEDIASAQASGVIATPAFFINGRRYHGAWDTSSLEDALLGSLGYRLHLAALDFVRWGPSAGIALLVATVVALVASNSPLGPLYRAFWATPFGLVLGDFHFSLSLQEWANDALLSVFFLVIGLEIKREFTVGHLASARNAALPIIAALGGMVAPALVYLLVVQSGRWAHGWGIPTSDDTAFALAVVAALGRRVPVELRVFFTATAVADDIGAILIIAIFYSPGLHWGYLAAAAALVGLLALMNRGHVYRLTPYLCAGVVLWGCIFASGLHATLAGVILALFIPTLPPPKLGALMAQANTIITTDLRRTGEALRHGPSLPTLHALDAIHRRLESPAQHLLRTAAARSSYVILPLFALANAGIVLSADTVAGHERLILAVMAGLVVGKPLGIFVASWLAVRLGAAVKPEAYSWRQLAGVGSLAGIGFTMALFVAGQAFTRESDFSAARIGILAGSILSAILGSLLLLRAARHATPPDNKQQT